MTLTNGRTSAYQWDYGLKAVTTEAAGTVARFANEHGSKAIPVEAVSEVIGDVLKVVYHIPDILLTTGRAIVMYHLGGDGETSVYTTSEDFLPVNEAPKPDDYIFTEEEIRTWQELDERLTEAEEDIVSLESGKADVVHTHTESDITDLKDYIVEPTSDGTNGQVLTTNGSGGRSWTSIPTEVLRVVFTQSGSTVTADQTYDTIYAAISAGKDVFGLLNGKVYYFGGVSSGAVMEFYAQDVFTAATGEIKVTTRNIGMNSGSSVVYTETERLFAPKSHTHTESDITDLGSYVPTTRTVNGKALSYNVSLDFDDLGDAFIATYGTTTWDDVDEAYAGGLTVYCKTSSAYIPLTTSTGSAYIFSYIEHDTTDDKDTVVSLIRTGAGWSTVENEIGSGGGGTSDYTDLTNKPSINSTTLSGNKTSADLGLAAATHTHTESDITDLGDYISDPSTKSSGQVLTYNGSSWEAQTPSSGGTSDYDDLTDKPSINSVTLSGNKTSSDLGLAAASHTHTESDITDLGDYIETPSSPSGGDVLTYNSTAGEWTAQAPTVYYTKPSGGIPATDLASSVQTSLGKADTAVQTETDPTVPSWAKASNKPSYTASEVGAIADPSTKSSGQFLQYYGSSWQAKSFAVSDISNVIILNIGADNTNNGASLSDIVDAYETTPAYVFGSLLGGNYLFPLRKVVTDTASDYAIFEGVSGDGEIVQYKRTASKWTHSSLSPVPTTRTVNGHALSSDVTVTINDVGAMPAPYSHFGPSDGDIIMYNRTAERWDVHTPVASDVGAIPEPSSEGTSGQVLATNGSGGRYWTTVSGGGTPEVFLLHEDPITGYPTESPADIAAAFNADNLLVYSNGINYYYVNYFSNDPSSVMYMIIPSAAYQNISTLELTYDYTQQSWSSSFSSWDLVPTARKVNNKALSSDITLTASDVGAIANPSSKTSGQFLSWNGSAWVATSLPVWNGSVT